MRDSGKGKEYCYRSVGCGMARGKRKKRIRISANIEFIDYDPWAMETCFLGLEVLIPKSITSGASGNVFTS